MSLIKKVFGNLALDFILLLALAALVSISSLIGLRQVDADYQNLVTHSFEIERLAAKIKTDLLEAVRLENAFLLNLENQGFETAYENYVVEHNVSTERLEQDLGQLTRLVTGGEVLSSEEAVNDLNKLTEAIIAYEADFATLVELLQERGTTQSGLEGEFRARAREIETLIRAHEDKLSLQVALLELRFFEESYLLHRSSEYAGQVDYHYLKLFGEVEDADISRQEKTEIEHLLDVYDDDFVRVVRIDEKVLSLEQEIDELVGTIEVLADNLDAVGRREAAIQMNQAEYVAGQTIQLVTMSVVVILIFGLGLTFAIAYQLKAEPKTTPYPATLSTKETV